MSKIRCLVCGKEFTFLPPHLKRAHGVDADAYREAFDLPAGTPLASDEYRQAHADKMRRMQADGRITYAHLPDAVEKSRGATSRPKRGSALDKQRDVLAKTQPWAAHQLPPGAKRADGRDADKAREYQRNYRRGKR